MIVVAIDMTYWTANERVGEGTKEPGTIALCSGLEGDGLSDYKPMIKVLVIAEMATLIIDCDVEHSFTKMLMLMVVKDEHALTSSR